MKLTDTIESFSKLGEEMRGYLTSPDSYPTWEKAVSIAQEQNKWFTKENILLAFENISTWLNKELLLQWTSKYNLPEENKKPLTVGVIMAGNIPLVGFYDILCVLITGNNLSAKLSHSDTVLTQLIVKRLSEINSGWKRRIQIVDKLSTTANAIIATGSNSTAKHFEYYFKNIPHIIRKNRNGVAVLDGKETDKEISNLGLDIFSYFGLGCRNVSKLYVPEGYDFANFFKDIEKYGQVINHNSYANNYNYNRTIYLMSSKVFTDNNFLMVTENEAIASPIAVLYFEYYKNLRGLTTTLKEHAEEIQCIAARQELIENLQKHTPTPVIRLGNTQSPGLDDHADGIDVVKFLTELNDKA